MNTLETLMQIQDELIITALPADDREIARIENKMIEIITAGGLPDRITPADLDALTDNNYHTIRRAVEKAMRQRAQDITPQG